MADLRSTLSLREQKEMFVTGHDGTSPFEILLVCSAAPISFLAFSSLRALEHYVQERQQQKLSVSSMVALEAVVIWLPFLMCQTNILYPWGVIFLWTELQLSVFVFLYFWSTQRWMRIRKMDRHMLDSIPEEETYTKATLEQLERNIMKDSMTVYRSSMLYMTFVAILAVDFHVFPRRFAKTETAGYGLMDLGAGSFVVAAGMVSSRARRPPTAIPTSSFGKKDLLRIAPLLLIGFLRLATNKGLEYQEHVSEYGVHWNFFFTLAVVTPLGSMLPGAPGWVIPTCLLTVYQIFLSNYGGQKFIETAPRNGCHPSFLANLVGHSAPLQRVCTLFAANREGVLGCFGYLSLYFLGEYIAHAFLWNYRRHSLWVISLFLWLVLYVLVESLGIVVSRRSTNASFCIWTLGQTMVLLAAIHSAMSLYQDCNTILETRNPPLRPRVPIVFQAVNRHGLLAFLFANLLTGFTNLTINTLAQSDAVALLILLAYLSAVGGFSLALEFFLSPTKADAGRHRGKAKAE